MNTTFKFAVVAAYAYADYTQAQIISRHKTYEAALRACRNNSFAGIEFL